MTDTDDLLNEATRLAGDLVDYLHDPDSASILNRLVERVRAAEEDYHELIPRFGQAVIERDSARAKLDALEAALRADLDQAKREAADQPYTEPTHLDDLLDIDPNSTEDRLAAMAVEYRTQRDDMARQLNRVREWAHHTEHGTAGAAVLNILEKPFPKRED
jgi:hypothetical protein